MKVYTVYYPRDSYYGQEQPLKTFDSKEKAINLVQKLIKAAKIYSKLEEKLSKSYEGIVTIHFTDKARQTEYKNQYKEFDRLRKIGDSQLNRLFKRLIKVLDIEMSRDYLCSYTFEQIPPYVHETEVY